MTKVTHGVLGQHNLAYDLLGLQIAQILLIHGAGTTEQALQGAAHLR